MGNRKTKRAPKRRGEKTSKAMKSRAVTSSGKTKHKRGDLKMTTALNVGYKTKQIKGGKWVKVGDRHCKIHTKCNCVVRTDPGKQSFISNR